MKKKIVNGWTLLLVSALLLFMVISYFSIANQPQQYQPHVSHSPSPTGVKAFYTYLENEYSSVDRWSNDPFVLPKSDENQLLIMIEPSFIPTEEEMDAYRYFMNMGNSILLFVENPIGMFDIKVEFLQMLPDEENIILYDDSEYNATLSSSVRIQTNNDDEILHYDEFGAISVKRSYGEGQLIVSNTPEWIRNDTLLNDDHVPLVLSLINEGWQDGRILFDEYIHGASPTMTTLYPKSFLVILLQGAIILLLWLWYQGKRFGPILVQREEYVRFSDESIKALAAWYLRLRGSRFNDSLKIQAEYIKLLMQERWGIPFHSDWTDRANQLERKWKSMPKMEIQPFLIDLKNVLEKEKISKQEYVVWSKKLEELRKGVEEG